MAKYKISFDRNGCIGCGACASINEEFWEMSSDGKSNLIKSKNKEDGSQEKEIEEKDLAPNKEAAESCPVNVIHIKDLESDEKII
ncbi:MAG: ferredoxin [Nanobdellota archaeon]